MNQQQSLMWDNAKIIHKFILKEKWKFNGDLNNFPAPQLLSTFLKWILIESKKRHSEGTNTCKDESEIAVITLIMQSVKTPRQTLYESTNANCYTYQRTETLLIVDVGLYWYHATRSKKLINFFSDLNIDIIYDKVTAINKDVSNIIIEKCKEINGVFLPSTLSKIDPSFLQ